MLVLERDQDERIVLDVPPGFSGQIEIAVCRGNKVKLGFNADKSVGIHRKEVWSAIQAERSRPPMAPPSPEEIQPGGES